MISFNRRQFLRTCGLGLGASLLTPFMGQFNLRAATSAPKRLVIVLQANGVEPACLLSPKASQAIDPSIGEKRRFSSSYKPMAQVIEDADLNQAISLGALGELQAKSTAIFGLSSRFTAGGGNHTTRYGALSCAPDTTLPAQETFDTFISQAMAQAYGARPFDTVRLGIESGKRVGYSTCAFAKGKPAPILYSPKDAFSLLFGPISQGAGGAKYKTQREILTLTLEDVKKAEKSFSGRTLEREKLSQYLKSLQTLMARQDEVLRRTCDIERGTHIVGLTEVDDPSRVVATGKCEHTAKQLATSLYNSSHPLERLQAQFDIATSALIGNLTNVVVICSGEGGGLGLSYSSLPRDLYPNGEITNRHDVCHKAGDHQTPNAYSKIVHAVTTRHIDMVAQMARTLDQTPEATAEGSMLDHTAILFMSDNGSTHHDFGSEWPALLVGGSKLNLNTQGQTLVYPNRGSANKRVSNLFVTLGNALGIQQVQDPNNSKNKIDFERFGQENLSDNNKGPISELYPRKG